MNTTQLIHERMRTSSKRLNRADPFHLALIFECGGMRGVAAGGAAMALEHAGLVDCFDSIHGSSAGACAGAYFLAQQSALGTSIYTDVISSPEYIHPWRLASRPAMVDVEKIATKVIKQEKPLAVGHILSEPNVLNVVTTNAHTGEPIVISNFQNSNEIYNALRSSLTIPGICEPGVQLSDGNWHIDGGISAPVPLFSALIQGATHIIIVSTKRRTDALSPSLRKTLTAEYVLLRLRYGRRVAKSYVGSYPLLECTSDQKNNIQIELISRSDNSPYCGRFTIDREVLCQVRDDSFSAAMKFCQTIAPTLKKNPRTTTVTH